MKRRVSSYDDGPKSSPQEALHNIRTQPPHIYDNITRRLVQVAVSLAVTIFIGLIVRYAVQEFDPTVSTITVTTSRIDNRDIAQLSVSKHFLERILEFAEESIAIVAAIIPIGFPICTLLNRYLAKIRAGMDKIEIKNDRVLATVPKYIVIGDSSACQLPSSSRLRPLIRDTIYQLIKSRMKPKLIVEDSYENARKLGIRIGLIKREHHKLAVIKSVDLLRNICDSRGDIKHSKVRYLLSRMKIMSQSTPADKSLLIYLMKHCESAPNENLIYLGYSFTDPEAMRFADCALTFQDCDDDDVKREAHVILKSDSLTFTDVYLFSVVCLLAGNITQSYALYQIGASVSCCLYRFLSITVFQEQLLSHSQFMLIIIMQQLYAIFALMTKWLASLARSSTRSSTTAEMSHNVTEDSMAAGVSYVSASRHARSASTLSNTNHNGYPPSIRMSRVGQNDDTLSDGSSTLDGSSEGAARGGLSQLESSKRGTTSTTAAGHQYAIDDPTATGGDARRGSVTPRKRRRKRLTGPGGTESAGSHIHLSGIDLNAAVINSNLVTSYKQTFRHSQLIDDVTYRLVKLHIAYQVLVMVIIMIFGVSMFQINPSNSRQHQTLALNSLIMNNIFNLANCFNQFGTFNLRTGFRNHPFFVCILLLAVFTQAALTELNAFGLESLNPMQWFACLVFALLNALIAPLTGQQARQRPKSSDTKPNGKGVRKEAAFDETIMAPADIYLSSARAPSRSGHRHSNLQQQASPRSRPKSRTGGGGGRRSRTHTPNNPAADYPTNVNQSHEHDNHNHNHHHHHHHHQQQQQQQQHQHHQQQHHNNHHSHHNNGGSNDNPAGAVAASHSPNLAEDDN